MRSVAMVLLLVLGVSGCSYERRVKHLEDAEFSHYGALKVWMTEEERKAYLKLKSEANRNAYLVELGLWNRFYDLPAALQQAVILGEVEVGWTKEMVLMSWGRPHDFQKLVGREAKRSERYVYRFELHEGGVVYVWRPEHKTDYKALKLFEKDVILDDDVVSEIHKRDAAL